ncbi:MAG: 1-acyl-sn-glycerol-3-phosphate acyltransferase, partial [Nocardioides sp.]
VGKRMPRPGQVTLKFGKPLDFAGKYDDVPPGRARRAVTDQIMAAIARLSGQEVAGVYNDRPADS